MILGCIFLCYLRHSDFLLAVVAWAAPACWVDAEPGHAASWCAGLPEICPSTSCLQPLNVANNQTFHVIEALLLECTGGVASAPGKPSPGVFKDNFVHLGPRLSVRLLVCLSA